MTSSKKSVASQTLVRGLAIIEAVSQGKRSMQEIAEATSIAFSTAYRLASSLVSMDYLQFEPRRGYRLGRKLIELGFIAYRESDLRQVAREPLELLAQSTKDTVHLAILDEDQVVYLDKISGSRAIEVSSRIGARKPICSTGVGKALILNQDREQWRVHFQREQGTSSTTDTAEAWLARMDDYADKGYTLDLGEDDPRIRCVAAPITAGNQAIVAAISVTSTVEYTDEARLGQIAAEVMSVAQQISRMLGS